MTKAQKQNPFNKEDRRNQAQGIKSARAILRECGRKVIGHKVI